MKRHFLTLSFLFLVAVQVAQAQNNASGQGANKADNSQDEQAIRQLISNGIGREHFTDDIIFASGRYPKPMVGLEELNNSTGAAGGPRKNFKEVPIIERVEVAASGDMAYAYGTSTASWEGREPFESAFLRVFRKTDQGWKVVAQFIRPHQEE